MPKTKKSARLIISKGGRGVGWLSSNPWRTVVMLGFVVLVSFEGVHQYKIIEAATIEQQAKDVCGSYGEKASPSTAQCIADKVLIDNFYAGWNHRTPDEKTCLSKLWTRESNWEWNATNSSSGAYGIPQALPASKLASVYNNPAYGTWQDNVVSQERWGLGYISDRYGRPCGAWNHELVYGWY